MFSSRVSAVGVAKSLSATIPHTAPAANAVSPYVAERRNFVRTSNPHSFAPVVARRGLLSSGVASTVNLHGPHQVRFAHTDISCPDFQHVRRDSNKDPHQPTSESREQRKFYTVGLSVVSAVPAVYLGKTAVKSYLSLYEATAAILAMARIEVNLSGIEEGKALVTIWRGKPLFIRHRTSEEIDEMNSVSMGDLRDPQVDADRTVNPKWLIVLGICTHLGCVPISHAGDFNGYFCPCHGSHYDASGRIRKGPAPLNLEVPPYFFEGDDVLVVG